MVFSRHFGFIMRALYNKGRGLSMPDDIAKFTVRTEPELLKKFRFVADYNGRSANREIEVLMKKHVAEFEKEHGKIDE